MLFLQIQSCGAETDGAGSETGYNIYGNDLLLARKAVGTTLYYLYNGHGDVTALVNSNGTVVTSYYYDAFGNITDETGRTIAAGNSYRYSGYQYDKESGLYYLNTRYYSAKIARFMSQDTYTGNPGDPLSLNLYTYVSNNPIRYFDPTGHGTVPVTLPDGTKTTGNVINGKTYLSSGVRVPEGSVVSTAGGDFMLKNDVDVKVDPVPVTTSTGNKTTGYVS